MKKYITIICSFFILVANSQNNQLYKISHIEKFKNAKEYTLTIANKMSDENFDFKPVKEEMSFKEQLVHIGENIYWLSSVYIKEDSNPLKDNKPNVKKMNKKDVLDFVNDAYNYALKIFDELDDESMSKEFSWNGGVLNKFQFLNLIQDHQSHHIGQLIVYLRLNRIAPPQYIGW